MRPTAEPTVSQENRPNLELERFHSELEDAIIRTCYWQTFGPLMPLAFVARFREHAASMPLEHARHDVEHAFARWPERRQA